MNSKALNLSGRYFKIAALGAAARGVEGAVDEAKCDGGQVRLGMGNAGFDASQVLEANGIEVTRRAQGACQAGYEAAGLLSACEWSVGMELAKGIDERNVQKYDGPFRRAQRFKAHDIRWSPFRMEYERCSIELLSLARILAYKAVGDVCEDDSDVSKRKLDDKRERLLPWLFLIAGLMASMLPYLASKSGGWENA